MSRTDTIGGVELHHGDAVAVLAGMADPALVIVDPPYGIGLDAHSPDVSPGGSTRVRRRPTAIAGDDSLEVATAVIAWADERGLPLVVFASPHRPLPGPWRNVLIWDKGPAVGGGGDPAKCWKRSAEMVYTRRTGELREGRDESVLRYHVGPGADFEHHPCQKPVPLLRYLIRQLTVPGDTILDPCMGSGSTGVAALRECRRFVGVEIDPTHYATAKARLAHAAGTGPDQLFSVLGGA